MKKGFLLLLALILCLAPIAYADGTGNVDYDYIISLLDRGEYDLAIQVIEMLRANNSSQPGGDQEAPEASETDTTAAEYTFMQPGEETLPAAAVQEASGDYRFSFLLENATDQPLSLVDLVVNDFSNGNSDGEFVLSADDFAGWDFVALAPHSGASFDDWHPSPAPFDVRHYVFTYRDPDQNEYKITFVHDMKNAVSEMPNVDYSQDQGYDLNTLRIDAHYQSEIARDVYWVPANSLGGSRYTNAEISQMIGHSPEEKQSEISTLYEALQLYQIGGFLSSDDNVRIPENGVNWEHHKPGYSAVLTNNGCCATDSNWLHYILSGDYDEIGYIGLSQPDGNGHVFNYILQDGWYYLIDLTHYLAAGGNTAVEDGNLEGYYASDFILGNIHKTQSLQAYADYIQAKFGEPPALIVKYTASDVPAIDGIRNPDGSVEIVYAQMNDLELEVLFDNPDDQLTLRFETAPTQQANW